jgi:hypothetical protein
MTNDKIIVYEIESITPGARHVWLKTNIGRIRKPVGAVKTDQFDFSETSRETVLVEHELLNWGKWLLKCTIGGMGYPSQSTTVTALQGSPSTTTPHLPTNPDAERVESVVKRIDNENKTWGSVLRKHYMRDLDATADEVANSMEIPARTYRYYLNMGRKKVELYLKRA